MARAPGVLLFDEDFDLPAAASEPEVIEPVYSAAELLAAREEAARESRDTAFAEAAASARSLASKAIATMSAQLTAAREQAATIAEQSAEAIARLLLRGFATSLPALSARHGEAEVTALLRAILPALHREPRITVRVNPHLAACVTEELISMDPDLAARVRLIPTDALEAGDVRVNWEHGAASRDAASLWKQIEAILAPAGLLDPVEAPNSSGSADTRQAAKEDAFVN